MIALVRACVGMRSADCVDFLRFIHSTHASRNNTSESLACAVEASQHLIDLSPRLVLGPPPPIRRRPLHWSKTWSAFLRARSSEKTYEV